MFILYVFILVSIIVSLLYTYAHTTVWIDKRRLRLTIAAYTLFLIAAFI